uniref:Uncharacterized protein n=1 Tax=Ornithorhynchus anatinus TaxID=9258 RepID=A0A6I8NME0_ORNAN
MAAAARPVRKRPVPACPNPLFVRWLTEWRDEAASRGRRTQFVYHKVPGAGGGQVPPAPAQREGGQNPAALRGRDLPPAGRQAAATPSRRGRSEPGPGVAALRLPLPARA